LIAATTVIAQGLALGLGWTSLALSVRLLSNPALAPKKQGDGG